MIAYIAGCGMKPDSRVSVWRRFEYDLDAHEWLNETYTRLCNEDRTRTGLLSYGILHNVDEENA